MPESRPGDGLGSLREAAAAMRLWRAWSVLQKLQHGPLPHRSLRRGGEQRSLRSHGRHHRGPQSDSHDRRRSRRPLRPRKRRGPHLQACFRGQSPQLSGQGPGQDGAADERVRCGQPDGSRRGHHGRVRQAGGAHPLHPPRAGQKGGAMGKAGDRSPGNRPGDRRDNAPHPHRSGQ